MIFSKSATAPVPVLLIRNSSLLPQFQRCSAALYCPGTSPSDTLQSITSPEVVLVIRRSPLLPLYQSYWYHTFFTYAPVPVLLIPYSISPTDTTQPTSVPVQVLLICYRLQMHKYQTYWYDTIHYYPNTSSNDAIQSTTAPVPVYCYDTVHFYHSTNPSYTLQYTFAPVPFLLIRHSTLLPYYQSYLVAIVNCCTSTSPIDMSQSNSSPIPVPVIPNSPRLS